MNAKRNQLHPEFLSRVCCIKRYMCLWFLPLIVLCFYMGMFLSQTLKYLFDFTLASVLWGRQAQVDTQLFSGQGPLVIYGYLHNVSDEKQRYIYSQHISFLLVIKNMVKSCIRIKKRILTPCLPPFSSQWRTLRFTPYNVHLICYYAQISLTAISWAPTSCKVLCWLKWKFLEKPDF